MDQDLVAEIARSLQWNHSKAITGTPKKWGQLEKDEQKLWLRMAHQALRKVAEAQSGAADEATASEPAPESKPQPAAAVTAKPEIAKAALPRPVTDKPVDAGTKHPSPAGLGESPITQLLNMGRRKKST